MTSRLARVGAAVAVTSAALVFSAMPASAAVGDTATLLPPKSEEHGFNVYFKSQETGAEFTKAPVLFKLEMTSGAEKGKFLKVYCVELQTLTSYDKDKMVEQPWDKYPNGDTKFNTNRAKINWVLHHGYPALDENQLQEIVPGLDDLESGEAMTATQAAIWHFSDGVDLVQDKVTVEPQARNDVKALYNYLVGAKNTGLEESTATLTVTPETKAGEVGGLVGPFKISTTGTVTGIGGELPDGVTITDKDGNAVDEKALKNGSEVYLKVPADAAAGEASFTVTGKGEKGIGRLFVGKDYAKDPAQSLIVAGTEEADLEASAKGSWTVPTTPTTTPAPSTTPAPQPRPEPELPNTGASILWPAIIGGGLVVAGGAALLVQRRRKQES